MLHNMKHMMQREALFLPAVLFSELLNFKVNVVRSSSCCRGAPPYNGSSTLPCRRILQRIEQLILPRCHCMHSVCPVQAIRTDDTAPLYYYILACFFQVNSRVCREAPPKNWCVKAPPCHPGNTSCFAHFFGELVKNTIQKRSGFNR